MFFEQAKFAMGNRLSFFIKKKKIVFGKFHFLVNLKILENLKFQKNIYIFSTKKKHANFEKTREKDS